MKNNFTLLFNLFFLTLATSAQTCLPPTNVYLSNFTASSTDLFWSDVNSPAAISFEMEIGLAGFVPTGTPTIPGLTTSPYPLVGLPPITTFAVYMRSVCGPNNYSAWTADPIWGSTLGPACSTPINLAATNLTTTSAELSWVYPSTTAPNVWELEIGTVGFTPTGIPTDTAYGSPFTVTNLNPTTNYCVYIRSRCSATNVSPWTTVPYCFTTLTPCLVPTNLSTANITTNSADIGWVDNNTPAATLWDLEIGPTGFTPTGTPTHPNINTNPYTLTGIAPNTALCAYVRSNCSPLNISPWTAAPVCFTSLLFPSSLSDITNSTLPNLIFPNPSSGSFSINENFTKKLNQLTVTDMSGKIVRSIDRDNLSTNAIKIIGLSPGLYYCKIILDNEQKLIQKVLIY